MVATSFVVATLLAQCFSRVDVATTVSRRDIVVFLFFWLLTHVLSSESGLFFLIALHVATSVLSRDHNPVPTAFTSFELRLRPQVDVATSLDVHFPSSGSRLNSLLQPISSF